MRRVRTFTAGVIASMILSMIVCRPMLAQSAASDGSTAPRNVKRARHNEHRETESERQVRELREQMAAQQAQIDALKSQISDKDAQAVTTQQSAAYAQTQAATAAAAAAAANAAASQASSSAAKNSTKIDAVSKSVNDIKTANTQMTANQTKIQDEVEHPAALHYKGITITPIAFFAAEGVYRQHSLNSDINTPFNSIPLPSASEGHTSELNFSGRQSRLGGLFEGNAGAYTLTGYAEMDFLGTGTSSNNNQSNSYVLRQRQIWGRIATQGGFAMSGGQMWSLVTEDRRGTDVRTEIQPQSIDAQYLVGYSWTRQPGFRVQQRFGDYKTGALTLAASAEQAQITGFTVASTVSAAIPTQYFFGGIGQNGGLYNAAAANGGTSNITTYANNVAPDVIVKAAFDSSNMHVEVGGLGRFLRDQYLPVATYGGTAAAPTYTYGTNYLTHTSAAGGVFGSARVYVGKIAEAAVQGMAGHGVGRYGSSQLADATLRPDETLEPIRNYHGLFSLETHPTKKLDVFAYYGGEYAQRTVYTTREGDLIGYGPGNLNDSGCYNLPAAPSTTVGAGVGGGLGATNCASPTRYIQEAMGGFVYRLVNSPTYGRLQYWVTYSYIQRNLWSGNNIPASGPVTSPRGARGIEPMVHISMRYYIP